MGAIDNSRTSDEAPESSPAVRVPTATQLVQQIQSGELSCRDALANTIERIQFVNSDINAVVVQRFERALEEAEQADRLPIEQRGSLHGLPVTIKEMFDVAGMPTTVGISQLKSRIAARDAVLVARWRRAGAIVVGKTNVPQLGIMVDSDNPVYGRTNNPWDVQRSPGGSTGGEAALIAAGGSVLGMGSDGAGSIRQPSHFCGVVGFKPTGGRYPMDGHWASANWPVDWATAGPLARTVDDVILGLRAFDPHREELSEAPPLTLHVPPAESLKGLRVGVYEQLGCLPAAPAIRRAVRMAAETLQRLGVEVVEVSPPPAESIWDNYMAILYAEGMRDVKRQVSGSSLDPRIQQILRLATLPQWLRPPVSAFYRWTGQRRLSHLLCNLKRPVLATDQYCQLLQQTYLYRRQFAQCFRQQRIAAIVSPAAASPALFHDEFYANYGLIYTGIYNLLAVPAGVVPVTCVRPEETKTDPKRAVSRDFVDQSLARANEGSAGLPIGVQIVGPKWHDGRVLGLMKQLQVELEPLTYPSRR